MLLPNRQIKPVAPDSHKVNVFNSPRIQLLIERIAQEQGVSKAHVEDQVRLILDEIGFKMSLTLIRWLGIFLAKFTCRACSSIYVNQESLNRVKSQLGNTPTVFVPSHRSYADFILMSYVLFSFDMEIPAIAAGMDFHGMLGMATVLRNTGAFFMRRIYNNDVLYWDTFRQYVHDLVTHGDSGIEFFIEGTRSRSCKSLPPKYGLLFMILRAFITGEVPDILFVPINISYDRVMEEKLFAFELLGVPKPKESTSGFFKALTIVNENFGNIYFEFGDPISVKQFLGSKLKRLQHGMRPVHSQELLDEEKAEITHLAENIVHCQQKLAVITTFNLIAVVLTNSLTMNQNIMRFEQLVVETMWLKSILAMCGAVVDFDYARKNIKAALDVHKNLIHMDADSNITLVQNAIVLSGLKESKAKLKGHDLSENTMTVAVPFVMLQIYVNPTLHYLINHSMVVAIITNASEPIVEENLFEEFKFLRTLFANDFFNLNQHLHIDLLGSLKILKDLNAIKEEAGVYVISDNKKVLQLLTHLLEPFLYSYFVICSLLNNLSSPTFEEKAILAKIQEKLEEMINSREEFVHPYVLSLDSISMCLLSLVNLSVLKKSRVSGAYKYEINSDALFGLTTQIKKYVQHKKTLRAQITSVLKNKL